MELKMQLKKFKSSVSMLMKKEYGLDWDDACGELEPLENAIDGGETPRQFVDWWATKYDMTPLEENYWLPGRSRNRR